MKSKLILSTTIAILALAPFLVADDVKYPPINPALTYWQSAAMMPELKGEKSDLLKDTVSGKKPFDAEKVKELLSQSDQSLRIMAKAAASPAPCDWGMAYEDGPGMLLPHVSKMMELSRLAILRAEALFAEGKPQEGIEWLLTSHRSARHAGAGDVLISALVQNSIEATTIIAAGRYSLGWDEPTRAKYADGFKALPPLHSIQDAFRNEFNFIDWFERLIQSPDPVKRQEFENLVAASMSMIDQSAKGATKFSNENGGEKEALIKLFYEQFNARNGAKHFAETRDIFRRTQAALGKPWKEGQAELQALAEEAQQGNLFVKFAYPAFDAVAAKGFEIATLHRMLDAILQYGPKLDEIAAATFKDSFDGEPLVLKKTDAGGLILTTARQYRKGKDIQLKLGK